MTIRLSNDPRPVPSPAKPEEADVQRSGPDATPGDASPSAPATATGAPPAPDPAATTPAREGTTPAAVAPPQDGRVVDESARTPAPVEPDADQAVLDNVQREFEARFEILAGHPDLFEEAVVMSFGADHDKDAAEAFRARAADGDFSWLPDLSFDDGAGLAGARGRYDEGRNTIFLDRALASDRPSLVEAYTRQAGRHIGTSVNPRGAAGSIVEYFDFFVNPYTDAHVERYLAAEAADTGAPPFGLEMFGYGSAPAESGAVAFADDMPGFVNGAIGTPPEVGELREGGGANFLNPGWLAMVGDAVRRNGGLGTAEDGFLAFSKEFGFVRLRNTGLSPEQNRQLAAMSLQTGWAVEELLTRTGDSSFLDPKIGEWADGFIDRYANEFQDFLADPTKNGISVSDGKRKYHLEYNEKAGGFVSYYFKKSGGFRGWVQKNFEYIMYGVGAVATVLTAGGYAAIAGAVSSAASAAFSYVATGTLKASQAIGAAVSGLGAMVGFTATQAVAANAAATIGGDLADDGDLDMEPEQIVAQFTPLLQGLPGGTVVDHAVREGLEILADLASGKQISAGHLVDALAPLVLEMPEGDTRDKLEGIAKQVDGGNLSAREVAEAIKPLFGSLTGDPRSDGMIYQTLDILADAIDSKDVSATSVLNALEGFFLESMEGTTTGRILSAVAEAGAHAADGDFGGAEAWDLFSGVTGLEGEDLLDFVFSSDESPAEERAA